MSPTAYSVIADFIAILHGIIAVWLASGFVFDTLLRRKLPVWYYIPLAIMVLIAFPSYIILGDCPLNPIEKHFRDLAGEKIYEGSFIAHNLQKLAGLNFSRHMTRTIELIIGIVLGILFFSVITRRLGRKQKYKKVKKG